MLLDADNWSRSIYQHLNVFKKRYQAVKWNVFTLPSAVYLLSHFLPLIRTAKPATSHNTTDFEQEHGNTQNSRNIAETQGTAALITARHSRRRSLATLTSADTASTESPMVKSAPSSASMPVTANGCCRRATSTHVSTFLALKDVITDPNSDRNCLPLQAGMCKSLIESFQARWIRYVSLSTQEWLSPAPTSAKACAVNAKSCIS